MGYGNPNGKILIIGKEHYFNHSLEEDSPEFYNEILNAREFENQNNISSWENNIKNHFEPEWPLGQEFYCNNSNAFTAWWNQKNKQDDKKGNCGTSNTYLHYQKLYQNVFLDGQKEKRINFQKEIFNSELNDLPAKKDFNLIQLNKLKKDFIVKRQDLFSLPFFKSFPVVIIASGHYPRKYNFNIEQIFDVDFIEIRETKIKKAWYNVHYSKDGKRLLIHTRQLSTSVPSELIDDLGNIIKKHLIENALL
ncbi:MAG: hypothetical protein ACOVLC_07700 [Flavobacterium sp.]